MKEGNVNLGQELGSPKESRDYKRKTTEIWGWGGQKFLPIPLSIFPAKHIDFCEALSCVHRMPLGHLHKRPEDLQ